MAQFHGSHIDWKMGDFPVREKSGNFEHGGKSWGNLHKILEKSDNFRLFYFYFSEILII